MIYFQNSLLPVDCRSLELGAKDTYEARREFKESCIGAKIVRTGRSWNSPDFTEIELDNGCVLLYTYDRDGKISSRVYDNKTILEFDIYSISGTDFYYISERRANIDLKYMKDTNYWELREDSHVYKVHVCVTPYFISTHMKVVDEEGFVNQKLNWVDFINHVREKELTGEEDKLTSEETK